MPEEVCQKRSPFGRPDRGELGRAARGWMVVVDRHKNSWVNCWSASLALGRLVARARPLPACLPARARTHGTPRRSRAQSIGLCGRSRLRLRPRCPETVCRGANDSCRDAATDQPSVQAGRQRGTSISTRARPGRAAATPARSSTLWARQSLRFVAESGARSTGASRAGRLPRAAAARINTAAAQRWVRSAAGTQRAALRAARGRVRRGAQRLHNAVGCAARCFTLLCGVVGAARRVSAGRGAAGLYGLQLYAFCLVLASRVAHPPRARVARKFTCVCCWPAAAGRARSELSPGRNL